MSAIAQPMSLEMTSGTNPPSRPQRRGCARFPAAWPVLVVTTTCYLRGVIEDVSVLGARVKVANPPLPGRDVLLRWNGRDVFGVVRWAGSDRIGIVFETPIPPSMVHPDRHRARGTYRTRRNAWAYC